MSSLMRWDPFRDGLSLREAMDRLFEDSFVRPSRAAHESTGAYLPLDIYTTKDAVVIRASVPGIKPDEVEITIEGNTITLRGEIKPSQEEGTFLLQEQRYGPFARSIELALPVQADKAEAKFENGVLALTIPKAEEIKPKIIKVKSA
ncbi:MAG: Hsp20/alpha crystallin family protein [Anaerolineales bacterium]|nr:Hsp20/alpha crystallin family protein [Anaerolineales bacterium]